MTAMPIIMAGGKIKYSNMLSVELLTRSRHMHWRYTFTGPEDFVHRYVVKRIKVLEFFLNKWKLGMTTFQL
jgi:hypothetical protein